MNLARLPAETLHATIESVIQQSDNAGGAGEHGFHSSFVLLG